MTLREVMTPAEWAEVLQFMQVASDGMRHDCSRVVSRGVKIKLQKWATRCDELRGKIQRAQV